MRRPILAANWKMHKTSAEARSFATSFAPLVKDVGHVDIVLAPPFTALSALGEAISGTRISLAAQNASAEESGAYTGEIAAGMLAELGCRYTIVGHSERRTLYGESSELVARKAETLLGHGILPIVCVGESLEEREAGRTFDVVGAQLRESLARIPSARAPEVVVAYEPIWAIGTGKTATPELAQEVHGRIRGLIRELLGEAAEAIRIQYGGSVKPDNVATLMAQPDIDGALVGGASLDPASFANIVHFEAGSAG
jgi:triosephosphate isomerase